MTDDFIKEWLTRKGYAKYVWHCERMRRNLARMRQNIAENRRLLATLKRKTAGEVPGYTGLVPTSG